MTTITFKGIGIETVGKLPEKGSKAPEFTLVTGELSTKSLKDFAGKVVVLNIVPSLDTGICALSAQRFNKEAEALAKEHHDKLVVVNVSADLPFAQSRFCESLKLAHISNLSVFRSPEFGASYGVTMKTGPLAGLLSRAVVVIDKEGIVRHSQQVPEIAKEPDYSSVLVDVKKLLLM